MAVRVYTKHGLRAHLAVSAGVAEKATALMKKYVPVVEFDPPFATLTFCGRSAVELSTRSRFFRRRLAQASVCRECREAQNVADAAR